MNEREIENIEKYKTLKYEIARILDIKKLVVGDLGTITTSLGKYATEMDIIDMVVEHAQKSAFFGRGWGRGVEGGQQGL